MSQTTDRREFLKSSTALLTAAAMTRTAYAADVPINASTAAEFIPGKDTRLIVHSTKTGELETPRNCSAKS